MTYIAGLTYEAALAMRGCSGVYIVTPVYGLCLCIEEFLVARWHVLCCCAVQQSAVVPGAWLSGVELVCAGSA